MQRSPSSTLERPSSVGVFRQPYKEARLRMVASSLLGQVVEPRAVVPEDPPFARLRQRQLEEDVGRLREVRVRVRVIGREYQRVVAELLDHPLDLVLVRVHADEALAPEILAGRRLQLRRLAALRHCPVLVEPPQEPRQPAAVALEERHA